MVSRYYDMMMALTHPAGTILFGDYVHTSESGVGLNIENILLTKTVLPPGLSYYLEFVHASHITVPELLEANVKLVAFDFVANASHK
jgi:hypothetical protein